MSTSAGSHIVAIDLNRGTQQRAFNSKHAGIGCIAVRSDNKIFATSGWDGNVRVYSYKSFRPLAVFRGGRQNGITCIAFSTPFDSTSESEPISQINPPTIADHFVLRNSASNWLAVAGKDGRIAVYSIY
jgi:WD40 repeat protein